MPKIYIVQILVYLFLKGNFDDKHEFFDLLLSYMFLCQILKMGRINYANIKKFTVTGQELRNLWIPYQAAISEKIMTWTYKLRNNTSKLINKEQCLKWTNKGFLQFLNSFISEKLGLQLIISKRDGRNAMNCQFGLRDNCEFDNSDSPKIRQFKIMDNSQVQLDKICLL